MPGRMPHALSIRIRATLAWTPGLKAREIADKLRVTRTEVNSRLYASLNVVVRKDHEHRWRLRNDVAAALAQVPEELLRVAVAVARTGQPRKEKIRNLLAWFGNQRPRKDVGVSIGEALQRALLRTEPELRDLLAVKLDTDVNLTLASQASLFDQAIEGRAAR